MKRILGIVVVLGLVGALTVMAQEVKPGKVEVVDLGKDVKLEMVLIPSGKFMMGFTKNELEDWKAVVLEDWKKIYKKKKLEQKELDLVDRIMLRAQVGKQHEVTLTKPFYIGRYEVTQEQWKAVMGSNPSARDKGAKLPVTDVGCEDCQHFIDKLNAITNGGYRLPTEAEWEYACRAGTNTAYSYEVRLTKNDANIRDGVLGGIKVVGSYKPNAFGLYDMQGNVMEWCNDWFDSFLQKDGEVTDRKGPATGDTRVLRGGSFIVNASGASSFTRIFNFPTLRVNFCGLRLARTP